MKKGTLKITVLEVSGLGDNASQILESTTPSPGLRLQAGIRQLENNMARKEKGGGWYPGKVLHRLRSKPIFQPSVHFSLGISSSLPHTLSKGNNEVKQTHESYRTVELSAIPSLQSVGEDFMFAICDDITTSFIEVKCISKITTDDRSTIATTTLSPFSSLPASKSLAINGKSFVELGKRVSAEGVDSSASSSDDGGGDYSEAGNNSHSWEPPSRYGIMLGYLSIPLMRLSNDGKPVEQWYQLRHPSDQRKTTNASIKLSILMLNRLENHEHRIGFNSLSFGTSSKSLESALPQTSDTDEQQVKSGSDNLATSHVLLDSNQVNGIRSGVVNSRQFIPPKDDSQRENMSDDINRSLTQGIGNKLSVVTPLIIPSRQLDESLSSSYLTSCSTSLHQSSPSQRYRLSPRISRKSTRHQSPNAMLSRRLMSHEDGSSHSNHSLATLSPTSRGHSSDHQASFQQTQSPVVSNPMISSRWHTYSDSYSSMQSSQSFVGDGGGGLFGEGRVDEKNQHFPPSSPNAASTRKGSVLSSSLISPRGKSFSEYSQNIPSPTELHHPSIHPLDSSSSQTSPSSSSPYTNTAQATLMKKEVADAIQTNTLDHRGQKVLGEESDTVSVLENMPSFLTSTETYENHDDLKKDFFDIEKEVEREDGSRDSFNERYKESMEYFGAQLLPAGVVDFVAVIKGQPMMEHTMPSNDHDHMDGNRKFESKQGQETISQSSRSIKKDSDKGLRSEEAIQRDGEQEEEEEESEEEKEEEEEKESGVSFSSSSGECRVVEQWPKDDPDFPTKLEWFCFPNGWKPVKVARKPESKIEQCSIRPPDAHTFSFSIQLGGVKAWGVCLIDYELPPPNWTLPRQEKSCDAMPREKEDARWYWPVCFCLLTQLPIVSSLSDWLLIFSQNMRRLQSAAMSTIDITKFSTASLIQLCVTLPCPIHNKMRVVFKPLAYHSVCDNDDKNNNDNNDNDLKNGNNSISSIDINTEPSSETHDVTVDDEVMGSLHHAQERHFRAAKANDIYLGQWMGLAYPFDIPPLCINASEVFDVLSAISTSTFLEIMACVLSEQKIILHSTRLDLLTPLAEIVVSLIWPLKWPHAFIPLLPLPLISVLQAPTPVLVGIHSDWLELLSYPLEDCVLVNIDSGVVNYVYCEGGRPILPPKLAHLNHHLRCFLQLEEVQTPDDVQLQASTDKYENQPPDKEQSFSTMGNKEAIVPSLEVALFELRLTFASTLSSLLKGFEKCIFWVDTKWPVFDSSRFLSEFCHERDVVAMGPIISTMIFYELLEHVDSSTLTLFNHLNHLNDKKHHRSVDKKAHQLKKSNIKNKHDKQEKQPNKLKENEISCTSSGAFPSAAQSGRLLDQKKVYHIARSEWVELPCLSLPHQSITFMHQKKTTSSNNASLETSGMMDTFPSCRLVDNTELDAAALLLDLKIVGEEEENDVNIDLGSVEAKGVKVLFRDDAHTEERNGYQSSENRASLNKISLLLERVTNLERCYQVEHERLIQCEKGVGLTLNETSDFSEKLEENLNQSMKLTDAIRNGSFQAITCELGELNADSNSDDDVSKQASICSSFNQLDLSLWSVQGAARALGKSSSYFLSNQPISEETTLAYSPTSVVRSANTSPDNAPPAPASRSLLVSDEVATSPNLALEQQPLSLSPLVSPSFSMGPYSPSFGDGANLADKGVSEVAGTVSQGALHAAKSTLARYSSKDHILPYKPCSSPDRLKRLNRHDSSMGFEEGQGLSSPHTTSSPTNASPCSSPSTKSTRIFFNVGGGSGMDSSSHGGCSHGGGGRGYEDISSEMSKEEERLLSCVANSLAISNSKTRFLNNTKLLQQCRDDVATKKTVANRLLKILERLANKDFGNRANQNASPPTTNSPQASSPIVSFLASSAPPPPLPPSDEPSSPPSPRIGQSSFQERRSLLGQITQSLPSSGFESLALLCEGFLDGCLARQDFETPFQLLKLTAPFQQVLSHSIMSKSSRARGGGMESSDMESGSENSSPSNSFREKRPSSVASSVDTHVIDHTVSQPLPPSSSFQEVEVLSARLAEHRLFVDPRLWEALLLSKLRTEAGIYVTTYSDAAVVRQLTSLLFSMRAIGSITPHRSVLFVRRTVDLYQLSPSHVLQLHGVLASVWRDMNLPLDELSPISSKSMHTVDNTSRSQNMTGISWQSKSSQTSLVSPIDSKNSPLNKILFGSVRDTKDMSASMLVGVEKWLFGDDMHAINNTASPLFQASAQSDNQNDSQLPEKTGDMVSKNLDGSKSFKNHLSLRAPLLTWSGCCGLAPHSITSIASHCFKQSTIESIKPGAENSLSFIETFIVAVGSTDKCVRLLQGCQGLSRGQPDSPQLVATHNAVITAVEIAWPYVISADALGCLQISTLTKLETKQKTSDRMLKKANNTSVANSTAAPTGASARSSSMLLGLNILSLNDEDKVDDNCLDFLVLSHCELRGHTKAITSLTLPKYYDPEQGLTLKLPFVASASKDGTLCLWNLLTKACVFHHNMFPLVISPSIATAGPQLGQSPPSVIPPTASVGGMKKRKGEEVMCLKMDENAAFIVAGYGNGTINVWRKRRENDQYILLCTAVCHSRPVRSISMHVVETDQEGSIDVGGVEDSDADGGSGESGGDRGSVSSKDKFRILLLSGSNDCTSCLLQVTNKSVSKVVFQGHTAPITCTQIIPMRKKGSYSRGNKASFSSDLNLKNNSAYKCRTSTIANAPQFTNVSMPLDDNDFMFASGSVDGSVRVWLDHTPLKPLTVFEGHTDAVFSLHVIPSKRQKEDHKAETYSSQQTPTTSDTKSYGLDQTILSCSVDGSTCEWDLNTFAFKRRFVSSLKLSPSLSLINNDTKDDTNKESTNIPAASGGVSLFSPSSISPSREKQLNSYGDSGFNRFSAVTSGFFASSNNSSVMYWSV